MRRALLALGLLAGLTGARAAEFTAELVPDMVPGQESVARFTLQLNDEHAAVAQAVWFLNIVQALEDGEVRQVGHLLFDRARESGDGFRRVLSGEQLRAGVSAEVAFRVSGSAPPGEYLIVLQLFEGTTTNPNRVRTADRIAIGDWPFTVLPSR